MESASCSSSLFVRRAAEKELAENEEHLKQILEAEG